MVVVTAVDPFGEPDMATVTIEIKNEDESPAINERTAKDDAHVRLGLSQARSDWPNDRN